MKKLLLLLVCIAGFVFIAKGQNEVLIEYNTGSVAGTTWTGKSGTSADGYTLSNAAGKSVSAGIALGDYKAIKFSNGAQYTISIPNNVSVSKVKFVAYSNDAATSSYLSELNGVTYGISDYTFPAGKGATTGSSEITFTTALTEKITFTFKPKETAGYIVLTLGTSEPTEDTTPPSLISSVPADKETDISLDLQNIELTFDEAIVLDASKLSLSGDAQIGSVVVESQKVTIPVFNLKYSCDYILTIPAGSVTDMAETPNATTEDIVVNFATAAPVQVSIVSESIAKKWDFTSWSDGTISNLLADSNWSFDSTNNRYSNTLTMDGVLKANDVEIVETKDLVFGNNSKDRARITLGAASCLGLNNKAVTIQINGLIAGQGVKIISKTASGSQARGVVLSNSVRVSGKETSLEMTTSQFKILNDGSAVIGINTEASGGILIYSIIVIDNINLPFTAETISSLSNVKLAGDILIDDIALLKDANLATIDVMEALSVASGLASANPNCLIYSSKALTGSKNVILNGEAEEIALVDGAEFNCQEAFNAQKITYTRSFTAAGMASLCLPFAVNTLPSGIAAEKYMGSEGTTVKFEGVSALEANTPYIATVEAQNDVVFEGAGEVVATKMVDVAGSSSDYTFKGMFGNIAKGDATGLYTLRADGTGFGRATENATVVPFRAYIQENGVQPSSVKMLILGHNEGGATNVVNEMAEEGLKIYSTEGKVIVKATAPQTINVYAINGQLVRIEYLEAGENIISDLVKGVYLIGNSKVVIR